MKPETKVKNIQRTLNEDPGGAKLKVDGVIGPKTRAAFDALDHDTSTGSGKGSWYSQHGYDAPGVSPEGRYKWVDKGDGRWNDDKTKYLGPNNALGVPDYDQGVAFYNQKTLGKWFYVTAPNGITLKLQQTDIGPHPKTGRKIDIAAVAAERFGYSPSNFPTDSVFYWRSA